MLIPVEIPLSIVIFGFVAVAVLGTIVFLVGINQ